jgi:hypothetical protein
MALEATKPAIMPATTPFHKSYGVSWSYAAFAMDNSSLFFSFIARTSVSKKLMFAQERSCR